MNSVISAATIEARNSGWDVLGIMDGFDHLIEGRTDEVRPLSITDVSRIHAQGGSIIRTLRANPTVRDEAAADPAGQRPLPGARTQVTVEGKNIGYELRCAPPIPFDIEYPRDLGYAAVDYLKRVLIGDEPGGMITIQDGHMVPLPFGSFTDPETGRVRIRLVDVESSSYRVAREYMIRLDRQDFSDPGRLGSIAAAAGLTPDAFRDRYGYLVQD
jgi:6-phosphofructokinase